MHKHTRLVVVLPVVVSCLASVAYAQHPDMPPGMSHEEHLAQMRKDADLKKRGEAAMGFDQNKTTHHFRLDETGGAIEVVANDPADAASIGQVRAHLKDIATTFARGDFAKPFATHGEVPPGVDAMREGKAALTFRYEDVAGGGRVRIATADATLAASVQEFLRYQIREHATGDPLTVGK